MSERSLSYLVSFVMDTTFSKSTFRLYTTTFLFVMSSCNIVNSEVNISPTSAPNEPRDEFYSINLWDEIKEAETLVIGKLSFHKKESADFFIRNYWEFKVTQVLACSP